MSCMRPIKCWWMRSSISPQIFERRRQEHVERVDVDGALARVLDRRDAEVRGAAFDLVEHLVDRRHRQRVHGVAEVLEHGRLRERALRPEIGDLERLLLREAGGHELAEQPHHLLVAQRPVVALDDFAQHLRLALRAVELGRRREALDDADLFRDARALGDQALESARRRRRSSRAAHRGSHARSSLARLAARLLLGLDFVLVLGARRFMAAPAFRRR